MLSFCHAQADELLIRVFAGRIHDILFVGERGGSVVECQTPEREVGGSKPTAAVLCP